ncbi:glucosidase [Ephemerocybe angulata]|uniref:Glucosidase n=1 Tax=Ephemerocybe angulata TaxID=980116 RepID=A0A8H6IE92_9AGAR|nr:glucosidase [Tulosesus angulatus]
MSSQGSPQSPFPSLDSSHSTRSHSLLKPSSLGVLRRESWQILDADSPYPRPNARPISTSTFSEKYSLSPDIRSWGADLSPDLVENDDGLHDPTEQDPNSRKWNPRGFTNVGCLMVLAASVMTLFIVYPVLTYNRKKELEETGINLGGAFNASGQIPSIGNYGLVDLDTPKEAWTKQSLRDGSKMVLVFSDEFNQEGRTFYPGDDPYWEAHDLNYWGTNNYEWYDPAALTTKNGALHVTLSEKETHGLHYQGGMMSTWNKFCFTGGYIEASVKLPGGNNVGGFWPAIWTLGNLGRAGYGASLEGMWPYTYDACDVGTAPNQTRNGLPYYATHEGDHAYPGDPLSYLPGQKLSRCTCPGEDHPGPIHPDGTFVGRSAPEIDIIEAQVGGKPGAIPAGEVSQSAQFAPFDNSYEWARTAENMKVTNTTASRLNGFVGNILQEAASVVTQTNQRCYQLVEDCFSVYGFEGSTTHTLPGYQIAKCLGHSRRLALVPTPLVEISARPIPQEPMYIIVNLGMSKNFGDIDFEHLTFPAVMEVDYIRVYQPSNKINIGCDPEDFPTAAYIEKHQEAYTNYNLTDWRPGNAGYGQPFPKNSFMGEC